MKLKWFLTSGIVGIIFAATAFLFKTFLLKALAENNFSGELFTFSTTLFGLILAAYGIIFGLVPSLRREVLYSETTKDLNNFFKFSLIALFVQILLSLVYIFMPNYWFFIANSFLLGLNLTIFYEIILTVHALFEHIISEKK